MTIKHFICTFNTNSKIEFNDIETVSSKAFMNDTTIVHVSFDDKLKKIQQSAFENVENLEIVEINSPKSLFYQNDKDSNDTGRNNLVLVQTYFSTERKQKRLEIQTHSFKNCLKLHTVIFPKVKEIIIEKEAFAGCESLRTVVLIANKVTFTENPFYDCKKDLCFVCNKNSSVDKFARENGFRTIYV